MNKKVSSADTVTDVGYKILLLRGAHLLTKKSDLDSDLAAILANPRHFVVFRHKQTTAGQKKLISGKEILKFPDQ